MQPTDTQITDFSKQKDQEDLEWIAKMPQEVRDILKMFQQQQIVIHGLETLYISDDYRLFSDVTKKGTPDTWREFNCIKGFCWREAIMPFDGCDVMKSEISGLNSLL